MQQPKPQRRQYAARTLQQVERALKNTSIAGKSNSSAANNYLVCRYDPWMSQSSSQKGVPDGLGRNITTRDIFGAYDIVTSPTADTELLILPTLPMQFAARAMTQGATFKVDGTDYTTPSAAVTNDVGNPPAGFWTPFGPGAATAFRNQYNAADSSNFIASGRIVTVGYRLYYTGPASTCEGIIQADTYPVMVDSHGNHIESAIKTVNPGGAKTAADIVGETAKSIMLNMGTAGQFITQNSVTLRPEAGAHSVLPRRVTAMAHSFKPYYEIGLIPLDNTWQPGLDIPVSSVTALFQGYYDLTNGSISKAQPTFPIVSFWDSDFDLIRIKIQGNSLKFRLEVITCIQFQHNNNFSLISLTRGPSEKNQQVLDKDDKMAPHVPPALPLATDFAINNSPKRRPRRRTNNQRNGQSNNNQRNNRPGRKTKRSKTVSLRVNGSTTIRPS